jgi:iron complex outermembrane receptor protein
VRGTNLTNEEARDHLSFLKEVLPLAGRGVIVGVRTTF